MVINIEKEHNQSFVKSSFDKILKKSNGRERGRLTHTPSPCLSPLIGVSCSLAITVISPHPGAKWNRNLREASECGTAMGATTVSSKSVMKNVLGDPIPYFQ